MKTLSLILVSLIFSLNATAQDFVYEGPAKPDVRSFWINAMGIPKTQKYAEGVAVLEAKLKGVKEKDPAYKTDKMEAEIAKWKAKAGSGATTEQPKQDFSNMNATQKSVKADELLRKLFYEAYPSVSTSTLPVIQFKFKEYNNLLEQYILLNTKPKESDIRRTKLIIEKHLYVTNKDITNIENSKSQNTTPESAEVNFYVAKCNQLYWDAAVKIFPEETSYADEYKIITDLVNKNGSLEDMKTGMNKNNVEQIKNRKLPTAVVKDAGLEKLFVDAFNNRYKNEFKGTAIKAVVLQSDWQTKRHEVSGVITGRIREGAIAYKGTNGKCYLIKSYYIHQEYIGTAFKNTASIYVVHSGDEMLCENVK
jgi:hypothetical protein